MKVKFPLPPRSYKISGQTDVTSTTELQNIWEEYEEALHVLHLDDMVEEAFAKSKKTDDSGDSGVDEY